MWCKHRWSSLREALFVVENEGGSHDVGTLTPVDVMLDGTFPTPKELCDFKAPMQLRTRLTRMFVSGAAPSSNDERSRVFMSRLVRTQFVRA